MIPIVGVISPPNAYFRRNNIHSHDFAIYILKESVHKSQKVRLFVIQLSIIKTLIFKVNPICLPAPYQEFFGAKTFAAGWGRFAEPYVNTTQSKKLLFTKLRVSNQVFKHYYMFGTYLMKDSSGHYKDPCSGDSGQCKVLFKLGHQKVLQCSFRRSSDVF